VTQPGTRAAAPAGEVLADYEALRRGVGAYELSRDVLIVRGPEAAGYLQGQCSQDVLALADGETADSLLLAPDGKVEALVRVVRRAADEFSVDVEGGHGETVAARLKRFKLRTKFDIEPVDLSCTALRGAGARDRAAELVNDGRHHAVPFEWDGWEGVDVFGSEPLGVPPDVRRCGRAAWESCRVEAGLPQMARELETRTVPPEVPGLVERTVSFTKGCFTGQELVARLDARGNKVARVLRALVLADGAPVGLAQAPESLVGRELLALDDRSRPVAGAKPLGHCTSAAWSPLAGSVVALGYVHRSVAVGALVGVDPAAAPGPRERSGEAQFLRAEVRELPLG
jgi:tRNA-modifying protein YgfZ